VIRGKAAIHRPHEVDRGRWRAGGLGVRGRVATAGAEAVQADAMTYQSASSAEAITLAIRACRALARRAGQGVFRGSWDRTSQPDPDRRDVDSALVDELALVNLVTMARRARRNMHDSHDRQW